MPRDRRSHLTLIAASTVAALLLSACGSDGPGETDQTGVPQGATEQEYRAAFAGVEPITLRLQTDGPPGSLSNAGRVAWAEAVQEWSGGAVTFEIGYSNSFVQPSTEWAAGLADGRIDVGFFLPYYNPDDFPELSTLTDATFLDGNSPLSTLVSTGWVTEMTLTDARYTDEAESGGVHILSLAPSANIPGIFCEQPRTDLADFAGVPVSAAGTGRFSELESLGFAPQSIAFTELFEAIQRGIVECGSTVPSALDTIGAVELLPHAVADPEAGLVGFPNYLAVGRATWEDLPLVARQLMVDRLDVFLAEEMRARSERNAGWLDRARAAGGGISPLGEDARAALLARNEGLLDDMTAAGTDTAAVLAAHDRWEALVGELYPGVDPSLEQFLASRAYEDVDLTPFVDRFFDEVLLPHRPA